MFSRLTARKWLVAAVLPAVFGVYYAFALPGQTTANAVPQTGTDAGTPSTQRLPDFTRIVEETGPSVVNVSVSRTTPVAAQGQRPGVPGLSPDDPMQEFFRRFGQPGPQGPQGEPEVQRGLGSGFIVSADGIILTNAHVVGRSPSRVEVALYGQDFSEATKIYVDPYLDFAIIRVPQGVDTSGIEEPRLECDRIPSVGHPVGAFGHPWRLQFTGTRGIISGVTARFRTELLQTDAPINQGNSGGPLISSA